MKPLNWQEFQDRITAWVNERQDGWTDTEARYVRNIRKTRVFFLRYNRGMSLDDAHYAFEHIKETYMDAPRS